MLSPSDIEKLADALALRLERIIVVALEKPSVRRRIGGLDDDDQSIFPPGLIERVLGAVHGVTGISPAEMRNFENHAWPVVQARDVAMWALKRSSHGDVSPREIADVFGTVGTNASNSIRRIDDEVGEDTPRGKMAQRVGLRLGLPGFGAREEEAEEQPEPPGPQAPPEPAPEPLYRVKPELVPPPERAPGKPGRRPRPRLPQATVDRVVNAVLSATKTPRESVMYGKRGVQPPPARSLIVWLLFNAGQPQADAGEAVQWDTMGSGRARKAVQAEVDQKTEFGRLALRLARELGIEVEERKAA